jgi:hypothetical protein
MQKSEVGITFEALSNSSELRSENCSTILIILFQIVILLLNKNNMLYHPFKYSIFVYK